MPSEIDIFREYISAQNDTHLGQPTTEQEIADFEAQYNIRLPLDVKEYILKINGVYVMAGFITLEALSEWEPMVKNKYYSAEYVSHKLEEADKYFRFGAYDVLVWHWLIKLDSNPNADTPIFVIYEKATKIADNFSDFLQKYRTNDPGSLLGY